MIRLKQNTQIIISLVLALTWALLFSLDATLGGAGTMGDDTQETPCEEIISTETPSATEIVPLTTLSDMWMVRIRVNKDSPPEITNVISLPEGRISGGKGGNSSLALYTSNDILIYEVQFTPVFTFGEPPTVHEYVEMIIVIPRFAEASILRLLTPYGDASYDLE